MLRKAWRTRCGWSWGERGWAQAGVEHAVHTSHNREIKLRSTIARSGVTSSVVVRGVGVGGSCSVGPSPHDASLAESPVESLSIEQKRVCGVEIPGGASSRLFWRFRPSVGFRVLAPCPIGGGATERRRLGLFASLTPTARWLRGRLLVRGAVTVRLLPQDRQTDGRLVHKIPFHKTVPPLPCCIHRAKISPNLSGCSPVPVRAIHCNSVGCHEAAYI